MKNIVKLIAVVLFILGQNVYAGGGWPKKKGTYYFKLASWWLSANQNFNSNGDKNDLITQGLFNVNFFGEYGITDRLTATAYVPFFTRSFENKLIENGTLNPTFPGRDRNSFGDSELGLKYGIFSKGKISITGSYTIGLPLGNSSSGIDEPLPTGDGELNHIFRSDIGISLYNSENLSLYSNVYGGVNVRSEGFSEELRLGAEVGMGLFDKKLWVITKLDTIQSMQNGDRNFDNSGGSLFANNVEVTNISPEIAVYITKKLGISASASIPISGKLVYSDPSYTTGFFYDFK